uniref:Inhibitor I9 domain-containing protein n=1 Tax=Fagus sylvatica TaxID=28930 RepID=A0A2N9F4C4_FAGSY
MASDLMVYSYKHGFSGFAAKLTKSQAQKLAELPGVVRVIPNSLHKLQTTRSWDFLGLSSHSPNNILHNSNMGDGVIIGVFDTGLWPESRVFRDEGLGPVPSRWKGACKSGDKFNATTHCNKKVIGARWYINGFLAEYGQPLNTSEGQEYLSPRDANGHGTHTASTAGGSFVGNVSYKGLGSGSVRGGAPHAHLAIYKVCWDVLGGQCASADILKAFDDAIHDGVDVLSLSIGSSIPLFSDVDERDGIATGSFHAVAGGITVVCAAAKNGPSAYTVDNSAPWILTVAASTMDRAFL